MLQERVKTYAERVRDKAIQEERLKIEKEVREKERLKIEKEKEEQVENMLDMDMDLSVISKLTKLSKEETLAIKSKVNKMNLF